MVNQNLVQEKLTQITALLPIEVQFNFNYKGYWI